MILSAETRELEQIVKMIWSVVLNCDVESSELDVRPRIDADTITGIVPITGDWTGMVVLECPSGLARRAAASMFEMPGDQVTTDQMQDAVGELTNIVGGNYKTLLAGHCFLGLPAVAEGQNYSVSVPGARHVAEMTFKTPDFSFDLVILGGQSEAKMEGALANEIEAW